MARRRPERPLLSRAGCSRVTARKQPLHIQEPNHPTTAALLDALARTYHAQGRYAEAEPLNKRSDVATSLNNLAELYRVQGRYAEAEPLYRRSLAIREKALPPEHPHVADSLENYAALLRKTGRDIEAVKLEARAKAIRAKHAEQNPAN